MKKAVIIFSIILLVITGLRVWHIARILPSAAVGERPVIEGTIQVVSKKWVGAPSAPKMDEMFDIDPKKGKEGKAGKNKTGSTAVAQEKKQAEAAIAKPVTLPHLFGAFSENGHWSAILKHVKTTDPNQKKSPMSGKEPGYILIPRGEAVNNFIIEGVSGEGVTFGLQEGEKRSTALFDFDRKGIRSLGFGDKSPCVDLKDASGATERGTGGGAEKP